MIKMIIFNQFLSQNEQILSQNEQILSQNDQKFSVAKFIKYFYIET